jgi:hypothetical protein
MNYTLTHRTTLSHRDAVLRMGATSLAFAMLYGLCNQLSQWRGGWAEGVFEWERSIPFLPWTIVPYLSIVLFFVASFFVDRQRERLNRHAAAVLVAVAVASLCYLLVPLRTAFERPLTEGPLGLLFSALTATDLPYNRAPSLHVALLVILWARLAPSLPAPGRALLAAWFWLIALSVLTTYQHHLIDMPLGAALGVASLAAAPKCLRVLSGSSWLRSSPKTTKPRAACAG